MTQLTDYYQDAIDRLEIGNDDHQRVILEKMQRICDALLPSKRRFWPRRKPKSIQGMYLYGPVGAGKTFLFDLLYQHVTESRKARFHYHQFMQYVDSALRHLQGQANPLKIIAARLAKTTRLLFLDEFLVQDIADAMILSELLQALFANGMILIATSNTKPDDLYWDGLQRARFLPAIAEINTHCEVVSIEESRDYRLGKVPSIQAYHYPLNQETSAQMQTQFQLIAKHPLDNYELQIQNRTIHCIQVAEQAVWFSFQVICNIPRSQLDYLELAQRFKTIFVSDIPQFTEDDTTKVTLFMHFIDVMYDKHIHVILSAAVPLESLYPKGCLTQGFQRTLSRLEEMQSVDYLYS